MSWSRPPIQAPPEGGAFCLCNGDGWLAYPSWADVDKTTIRIIKVRCPRGCPLKDPNEPGLQPFPRQERP